MRSSKVLLLCALLLAAGCSQNRYNIGQTVPEHGYDTGTSLQAVLDELGPPVRMSAASFGYVLAYEYWYISEDKLGISLAPLGIDFIAIDFGEAKTSGEYLLLSFDRQHRLIDSRFDAFDRDAGGGQGIQALASVVDVVDVSDLTKPLPTHRWGGFALEELPVTLNRDQNIDSGQNGLEQRGTPVNIGQRATEMP